MTEHANNRVELLYGTLGSRWEALSAAMARVLRPAE